MRKILNFRLVYSSLRLVFSSACRFQYFQANSSESVMNSRREATWTERTASMILAPRRMAWCVSAMAAIAPPTATITRETKSQHCIIFKSASHSLYICLDRKGNSRRRSKYMISVSWLKEAGRIPLPSEQDRDISLQRRTRDRELRGWDIAENETSGRGYSASTPDLCDLVLRVLTPSVSLSFSWSQVFVIYWTFLW